MTETNILPKHKEILDLFNQLTPKIEDLQAECRLLGDNDSRKKLWDKYHRAVESALGSDITVKLIDFFTEPAGHAIKNDWNDRVYLVNAIASVFCRIYCEKYPTEYSLHKLLGRLCWILETADNSKEVMPSPYAYAQAMHDRFFYPKASLCLDILSKHTHHDFIRAELKSIFAGKFNKTIVHGEDAYTRYEETNPSLLENERYDDSFKRLVLQLHNKVEFDYLWFKQASLLFPSTVERCWIVMDEDSKHYYSVHKKLNLTEAFLKVYQEYYYRLLQELVPELKAGSKATRVFDQIFTTNLPGLSWMRIGLDLLVSEGRSAKALKDREDTIDSCIKNLMCFYDYASGETEADLIGLLKNYDEKTLLTAYPYAGKARLPLLKALGWNELIPVHQAIFLLGNQAPDGLGNPSDFYNSESTTMGVIDRSRYLEMIGSPDIKQLTKLIKAIRASDMQATNILTIITSLLDMDREKIEKSLSRHTQISIKAYGLFPLRDEEDLKERYLKFKQMSKDASQYGAERTANTRAAVICGLKNLAQTAGYTDEVRLEWAMEANIASDMVPFNEKIDALDWQVSLKLEGITPKIYVYKQNKLLQSVPPAVRKTDIYQKMREAQEQIKRQSSAFRHTLEAMMCDGDIIELEELATLSKLPVVSCMLSQLILKVGDQQFGLFSESTEYVTGLNGKEIHIATPPSIAHVYDLFEAKVLSDWQRFIVENQVVQPFKQAFRELYIVTPAEIEAGTHSRRFIGHVVDGAKTSRLLQGRKWSQNGGDVVDVFKRFPKYKTLGVLNIPDSRHYLAESDSLTLDEIWFVSNRETIPLNQVNPLVFSEFMRDVDLVASVARVDDQDYLWSTETTQRRAELVLNLIHTIGLKQVSCEGHYAYVQGTLAKYRIHLGTGVIHIQPGNYLCIVPKREKQDDFYLPFADVDSKMSEIISKIFLLIADDKIEDQSILSQIEESLAKPSTI